MSGGGGNDTYIVDNAGDSAFEWDGAGFDVLLTSVSYDLGLINEIEVMQATGTANIDLVGSEWNNTIVGNNGNNTIVGSSDHDGGLYDGFDVMTGNGGGDVFVWSSTAETRPAADQADVITDFNRAQGDLIALNLIDANEAIAGNQAFTFVGQVDFTSSFFTGAGQVGYFTTATDTYILLNTKVDGGAVDFEEATIRLAGVHTPDASWFVL
jgi:Ca2+-binding RTX toxin-like protein